MPFKNKEDKRKYDREWVSNRRKSFFENKSCVKCGSTEKLELDHINREDKKSHKIWSWSKQKREDEIKKCQILCHNCHLEKTIEESTKKFCINGHDISKTGRYSYGKITGNCKECHKESRKKNYYKNKK